MARSAAHGAVEARLGRNVADLKRLIDQQSVSNEGRGLGACARLCATVLAGSGFATILDVVGDAYSIATAPGGPEPGELDGYLNAPRRCFVRPRAAPR